MITHSGFLDLAETDAVLSANGLAWHIAATRLLHLPTEKLRSMTHGVLESELGRSIFVYGAYAFVEVHIVEISQHEAGG